MFNTPVKSGTTKMTWNSPFQPLNPQSNVDSYNEDLDTTYTDTYDNNFGISFDLPIGNHPPNNNNNAHFNTDIPVLDDLFTELNSDLNYFDPMNKSEPVNLEDIERILLPTTTTSTNQISRRPTSKLKTINSNLYSFNIFCFVSSPTTF